MKSILKKYFFYLLPFLFSFHLKGQHDTTKANLLLEEGIVLYEDGAYEKARKPLQKALALRQKHFPKNHVKIEDVYYWLGSNEEGIRNSDQALEYYFAGLEIAKAREGAESVVAADFYMDIANTYDQKYEVATAKQYYEKVLRIYQNAFGEESREVGNAYMNIAYGQKKMGNYRDAEKYYKKAFQNFQKSSAPNSKDFYRIYINHCVLLYDLGDYERALDFAHKALTIKLIHYDTLHPSVYKYFGNIGDIYQAQGKLDKALPYAQKALEIAEKTRGKKHPETAGLLGTLGSVYADQGKLDQALKLHLKAMKIQEQGLSPTHPYLVTSYRDIGRIYEAQEQWAKALYFYEEALRKYQNAAYVPHYLVAETLGKIAEVYFAQGAVDQALKTIASALQTIAPSFASSQAKDYRNFDLQQVQAEASFLALLQAQSLFLHARYQQKQTRGDLEQALQISELAIALIEKIRSSYQSESAKEFLNHDTAPIYDQAVEQAFDLFLLTKDRQYLIKAFHLSEKSKASILWQSINNQYALEASGIPPEKLDSLRSLDLRIADLEEQLFEASSETDIPRLRDQIFDLKIRYERLVASLEKLNPQYFQLKYANYSLDLDALRKQLPDQQSLLIEYFYTSKHLYIFTLSQSGLKGVKQNLDFDLSQAILALRNNDIHQIALGDQEQHHYIDQLHQLYALCIQPIEQELRTHQNLLLIPHGVLQYLSFESLAPPASGKDFRSLDYLLKKYRIQYHWSIALWTQKPAWENEPEYHFLGFAPDFSNTSGSPANAPAFTYRRNLTALNNALPELEGASAYFSGRVFAASEATESQFKQSGPQSKIIHLATHAIANDLSPLQSGLLFSEQGDSIEDGFLHALEIYNMKLSADLAVMSACNTGFGQFAKGEGIMSLGRAFLYAGCKSVLMSLWLANDESTSSIVQQFYHYAANGWSKDEALRQAKIDYLSQADPLTAHPYFWANLVAVGDMRSLQTGRGGVWRWGLGIGGVLLLLLFWWRQTSHWSKK